MKRSEFTLMQDSVLESILYLRSALFLRIYNVLCCGFIQWLTVTLDSCFKNQAVTILIPRKFQKVIWVIEVPLGYKKESWEYFSGLKTIIRPFENTQHEYPIHQLSRIRGALFHGSKEKSEFYVYQDLSKCLHFPFQVKEPKELTQVKQFLQSHIAR